MVRLVAKTEGVGDLKGLTVGEILAYVARVSNPSNQMNHESSAKLLLYCLRNQHWSVFESASLTMEIVTSRAIAQQILRHRSFVFQEFCVAGDTLLYFDLPRAEKTGRRHLYKMPISEFHRKWSKNPYLKKRLSGMRLRFLDQESMEFRWTNVSEVKSLGPKPVFKFTLANGKSITCTKEHKFFIKESGFVPIGEALDLKLTETGKACFSNKNCLLACNGEPCHQNPDWLANAKTRSIENKTGVQGIADEAGVSYHTVRKWLKKLGLGFTKKETASMYEIWNKGKTGYKNKPFSEETRQKMRGAARKGPDSNLWRGGVDRGFRLDVTSHIAKYRNKFLYECNYSCKICGSHKSLELHHIQPVHARPDLAYDLGNIEVVCMACHDHIHGRSGEYKIWREKSVGNLLTVNYAKVVSVEYLGEQETYDLEVADSSHNYVANGIVTHNSQRYSEAMSVETYPARRQDTKNRQASVDDMSEEDKGWFLSAQEEIWAASKQSYDEAIRRGIAKEQARFLLPLATQTKLYMTGNIRSWLTYCKLRCGKGTQLEHREIALGCLGVLLQECPELSEYFEEESNG